MFLAYLKNIRSPGTVIIQQPASLIHCGSRKIGYGVGTNLLVANYFHVNNRLDSLRLIGTDNEQTTFKYNYDEFGNISTQRETNYFFNGTFSWYSEYVYTFKYDSNPNPHTILYKQMRVPADQLTTVNLSQNNPVLAEVQVLTGNAAGKIYTYRYEYKYNAARFPATVMIHSESLTPIIGGYYRFTYR
jgi:YD repeat-containing protein